MITVRCPACERETEVETGRRAGGPLRITCPSCQTPFTVSAVATSRADTDERPSLSEGTFEMPGDPDVEDPSQERRTPVREDPVDAGAEPGDARRPAVVRERTVVHDPRTEESAPRVPVVTGGRGRGRGDGRPRRRRMVVTNLPSITGYRIEPLGMVAHHFCRPSGGEGKEARRRVRAFGDRYRKALELLGAQARQLGADTVLGVQVTIVPTGPDGSSVWVLVQGTAARRHHLDPSRL